MVQVSIFERWKLVLRLSSYYKVLQMLKLVSIKRIDFVHQMYIQIVWWADKLFSIILFWKILVLSSWNFILRFIASENRILGGRSLLVEPNIYRGMTIYLPLHNGSAGHPWFTERRALFVIESPRYRKLTTENWCLQLR